MEFGTILDDALAYTTHGVFHNTNRWLKLIIAILCLGIPMNGYVMRIYRGEHPAPAVDNWGTLFVDGLKLMIVGLLYTVPVFIIWAIAYGSIFLVLSSGNNGYMDSPMVPGWAPNIGFVLLMYLVEFVIALILPVASIRFARTNSFSEAFNIGAILGFIFALILIILILSPLFATFQARYMTLVYDSVEP